MDKVEHFEIPADNVDRATRFYESVFGWQLNPIPGVSYTRLLTIRVDENVVAQRPFEVNGAIVKRGGELMTPIVTVSVENMDDTLSRVENEGGKIITGKTEFGDKGYTSYFRDTERNLMGLWQVRRK